MKKYIPWIIGVALVGVIAFVGLNWQGEVVMGGGRINAANKTILSAATAASTTASAIVNVGSFAQLYWTVGATNASATIKFACSFSDVVPTFTIQGSSTNTWDYIDITDMQNESSIDGDTGITFTTDSTDARLFQMENTGYKWCTTRQTGWHEGTLAVKVLGSTNF
jgi:hypothetical protein